MKKIAILAFMLISSVFTYADNVLSAEDITIAAGEKATVSVSLDNTYENISGIVFKMTLPDWLEFVSGSAEFETSRTNDEGKPDFAVTKQEDNVYQIFYNSSEQWTYYITGNSGLLFSFQLQIKEDATVEDGTTATIKFSAFECFDIDFNDLNSTLSFADINVTVGKAAAETVSIELGNANSYNTYVSDKDLDFTGLDATAYIVTGVSASEATLQEVTTIAAGEGFLILGAGEETIEVPVAAETPAASGTLLKTGQPSDGDYLLATDGSAFVLWNGEGTLAPNKAYLPASAIAAGAKPFSIDLSTATGINEVKTAKANGAIYSISGVRVAEPQKGVYIMNGRKVIVK